MPGVRVTVSRSIAATVALAVAAGLGHWLPGFAAQQPVPSASGQTAPALPAPFFHWPKDQKPDAVVVLTGQTWGYLRPCGCSEKQTGGLERRANLIASLRKKGWPVTAADLGDVPPPAGLTDQVALKYKTAMTAMKEMGYAAVGVGTEEFKQNLDTLTGQFSLQPGNERPRLVAANVLRKGAKGLADSFPTGPNSPPYVGDAVVETVGIVPIGFVGCVESTDSSKADLAKVTKEFELGSNVDALNRALASLDAHPKKPALRVLLFQGSLDAARLAAKAYPQFQIILCLSSDALPPMVPERANDGKTMLVQVGHKGQYAGVAGAFKQADGSIKVEYQLIEMTEEYLTPKDATIEANDPILKLLQKYSDEVRDAKFLDEAAGKKTAHNAQIRHQGPNKLTYVGSDGCKSCHPQEHAIWANTKHATALKFLEDPKYAFRPTGRNHDPECVTCHVVGFEFTSGFTSKEKTPHLMHVGCENCHGPGSGHAANPNDAKLKAYMMPWKANPLERLPKKDQIEQLGKTDKFSRSPLEAKFTMAERMVVQNVIKMCMGCHDPENDPKFDLYEYMPKMWHSGFGAKKGGGLPPGLPPGVGK